MSDNTKTLAKFDADLNIIQKLGDEPNTDNNLNAAELKEKFDEAANIIQRYINETLIPYTGHLYSEDNPPTVEDIGAAPKYHEHDASDITSGILPVARGGTGVSDVFELATALGAAKIQKGSYKGTGKAGSNNKTSLTFDFVPKIVFIQHATDSNFVDYNNGANHWIMLINGVTRAKVMQASDNIGQSNLSVAWSNKTVSFYHTYSTAYAGSQLNLSGVTYHFVALG